MVPGSVPTVPRQNPAMAPQLKFILLNTFNTPSEYRCKNNALCMRVPNLIRRIPRGVTNTQGHILFSPQQPEISSRTPPDTQSTEGTTLCSEAPRVTPHKELESGSPCQYNRSCGSLCNLGSAEWELPTCFHRDDLFCHSALLLGLFMCIQGCNRS